jgi:hypothetical protein
MHAVQVHTSWVTQHPRATRQGGQSELGRIPNNARWVRRVSHSGHAGCWANRNSSRLENPPRSIRRRHRRHSTPGQSEGRLGGFRSKEMLSAP